MKLRKPKILKDVTPAAAGLAGIGLLVVGFVLLQKNKAKQQESEDEPTFTNSTPYTRLTGGGSNRQIRWPFGLRGPTQNVTGIITGLPPTNEGGGVRLPPQPVPPGSGGGHRIIGPPIQNPPPTLRSIAGRSTANGSVAGERASAFSQAAMRVAPEKVMRLFNA